VLFSEREFKKTSMVYTVPRACAEDLEPAAEQGVQTENCEMRNSHFVSHLVSHFVRVSVLVYISDEVRDKVRDEVFIYFAIVWNRAFKVKNGMLDNGA